MALLDSRRQREKPQDRALTRRKRYALLAKLTERAPVSSDRSGPSIITRLSWQRSFWAAL